MKGTTKFCIRCNSSHQLVYVVAANEETHMAYFCPHKGGRMTRVPKIEGLRLPVVQSKQWHKAEQEERQQRLL